MDGEARGSYSMGAAGRKGNVVTIAFDAAATIWQDRPVVIAERRGQA
jgi:hypothetical protein